MVENKKASINSEGGAVFAAKSGAVGHPLLERGWYDDLNIRGNVSDDSICNTRCFDHKKEITALLPRFAVISLTQS